VMIAAALLGPTTLCIGAYLGASAEFETTLFSLAVSVICWLAGGALISCLTPLVDSLTIHHDSGAAFRFGGLWVGMSVLFAHATASAWVSYEQTTMDLKGAALQAGVLLCWAWILETGVKSPLKNSIKLAIYGVLVVVLLQLPPASAWLK
jgi:hypothetical protein